MNIEFTEQREGHSGTGMSVWHEDGNCLSSNHQTRINKPTNIEKFQVINLISSINILNHPLSEMERIIRGNYFRLPSANSFALIH